MKKTQEFHLISFLYCYITTTVTEETFLVRLHYVFVIFISVFLLFYFTIYFLAIPATENNAYSSVWCMHIFLYFILTIY